MWKSLIWNVLALAMVYGEVTEEGDVLVLDDANFEEVVLSHDLLLVEFYAPWCGHCKSLAPEYEKAAGALKALDTPIRIAKVDATAATEVANKFGIQGFPTLKLFRKSVEEDDAVDYDGGRTADEIEKWMIKKSGPAVSIVSTAEEVDALKAANDVVVIAYVDDVDGEHRKILEKVAAMDDNAVYVATSDAALVEGKTLPALTLFKTFDEGVNQYEGAFEQNDIADFVGANSMPLITIFSQEKASQIFGGDISVHVLMFSDDSKDYHESLLDAAKVSATEHKGQMLHIVIPVSEDRILDYFGFTEADLPAVMLVNMEKGMKKFAFEKKADELSAIFTTTFKDDLLAFEKSYLSGELQPALKSAEPADDSDEAVKVIVGKSFKERVVDSDQDVLLEFYAPWCGHCKSLAPKYDELAEKFSDVKSIMIAKMDATENEIDHPGVDVQGFPTIIFFPAKDKQNPVSYEGARDVDGFTKFLKENARSFEFEGETHGKAHDEL